MFECWKKPWTADRAAPYSQLAGIYDYVMRHVDYTLWADYVQSIFARYRTKPATILELACGTGSLALILADRGYRVTGVDQSDAMVSVARKKAERAQRPLSFIQGNMTAIPVEGRFDAVLCLYDSINYLLDRNTMQRMMEGVRTRLSPGGVFVFDACTEINSRRYFHGHTEREETPHFAYIRRSEYRARDRIQVNEFRLWLKHGDRFEAHDERHEQRIYPIGQMVETIGAAGFDVLGTFDGFSFTPATEQSNRVHFVVGTLAR